MRGRFTAALLVGILAISAIIGVLIKTTIDDSDQPDGESRRVVAPAATPTSTAATSQPTVNPPAGTSAPPPPATIPTTDSSQPVATPADGPAVELLSAAQPAMQAPTIASFERLEEYYAEAYAFGNITVHWAPGAFPPERAAEVAALAEQLRAEANQRLGTADNGPIDIFLANQLYDEKCIGCQGLATSDYRQVFILQDGSVAPDEFEALLIHEITHVIAGNAIQVPHVAGLFYAEGLATWMMAPHFSKHGYIEPRQIAAWALQTGQLPSLDFLLFDAGYEGRTRARIEYDAAGSFATYIIETYGMAAYQQMYKREVLPTQIIGKSYPELEQEWHAWLNQWAANEVNGVSGAEWWNAMNMIISGFDRVFTQPQSVTADQYSQLASARVALNRGDLETARQLVRASDLTPVPAS